MLFTFILLLLLSLFVGYLTAKKETTFEEFTLSRNHFGTAALSATIIASFIGGGAVIGTAEKAFSTGMLPAYALLGFSIQLFLTATFIAPRIQNLPKEILTVGDLFGYFYHPRIQILVNIVWGLFSIGLMAVQLVSISRILGVFIPLDSNLLMVGAMLVTTSYCMLGGIRAVVATDIMQLFLMYAVVLTIGVVTYHHLDGLTWIETLPSHYLMPESGTISYLTAAWFGFIMGDALIPPVMQRLMMSDQVNITRNSMLIGSIGIIPLFGLAAFAGMACYSLHPDADAKDTIHLIYQMMPTPWFGAILMLGLSAAVLSSLDSYLHITSTMLTQTLFPTSDNKKKQLFFSRITLLVIGSIAIFVALYVQSIFDALLMTYRLWGPLFVIPIIGICTNHVLTTKQLLKVLTISASTVILWNLYDLESLFYINDLMAGILANLTTYLICWHHHKKLAHAL